MNRISFCRKWMMSTVLMFTMLLISGQAMAEGRGENQDVVQLQILSINDFHGALTESGKNPGAAKMAAYIEKARDQNPKGSIVVSAGDMFQGSPDSNLLYGKTVVDVMNYTHFDAMTLGNHEFDWGIDVLKQRIQQSAFPYICANVIDKRTGKPADFVKPYIVLERKGVKIGIIGIATPETAYKTNPKMIENYTFADPIATVNKLVPVLKKQGVQIIIALTHLGSEMDSQGNLHGDAVQLAQEVDGLDAVISGHSHQEVFGQVHSVPVVQAYYNGRAVGKIDITYNKRNRKVETAVASVTTLSSMDQLTDQQVKAMIEDSQKEIAPVKNIVVGHTLNALPHDRNEMAQTTLGQWVTDTLRQTAGADIAFQNTGGLRTGIMSGDITMGNLYEVMPFDNTLFTVEMTGAQVMQVLEYGIGNKKIGMLQYSGLKIAYETLSPAGVRIAAVMATDGTLLQSEKKYKVVINDFMAVGGDGFTMFREGTNLHDTGIPVRDIIAEALRKQQVIDFLPDDRWQAAPSSELQDAA
ncbi:bifunctional UDP-sugar hydrolase/5'-nucleotidase [Pelosinus sp. UFO1]|uniref:bifunctional metallophosphatase/5'-nucleotidase n=1 Tax=Pelosinus sp. UFO1 TaxID=484770 RepID=UPI0004D15E57|nr:5'-nucleotidase C-terminal domain-containing protein [Pelosinus sp. UFO1]AIF54123.1 5'-nucleotidase [Pelosinus sp. UFO1]